jgi:hypothetical protein
MLVPGKCTVLITFLVLAKCTKIQPPPTSTPSSQWARHVQAWFKSVQTHVSAHPTSTAFQQHPEPAGK